MPRSHSHCSEKNTVLEIKPQSTICEMPSCLSLFSVFDFSQSPLTFACIDTLTKVHLVSNSWNACVCTFGGEARVALLWVEIRMSWLGAAHTLVPPTFSLFCCRILWAELSGGKDIVFFFRICELAAF